MTTDREPNTMTVELAISYTDPEGQTITVGVDRHRAAQANPAFQYEHLALLIDEASDVIMGSFRTQYPPRPTAVRNQP